MSRLIRKIGTYRIKPFRLRSAESHFPSHHFGAFQSPEIPERNTLGFACCDDGKRKLAQQASSRAVKRSAFLRQKNYRRVTAITDEARIRGINHSVMPQQDSRNCAATDSESDGSHFVRDTELQERWGHLGLGTLHQARWHSAPLRSYCALAVATLFLALSNVQLAVSIVLGRHCSHSRARECCCEALGRFGECDTSG